MEMMDRSRAKCAACLKSEAKRVQSNHPWVRSRLEVRCAVFVMCAWDHDGVFA